MLYPDTPGWLRVSDARPPTGHCERHEWSDEEKQKLVTFRQQGLSWVEVSLRMNIGIDSVKRRYWKMMGSGSAPLEKTRTL